MVFIPYLWSRINWKAELGLLGILHGQPLHKKGSKSWACSSTEGVKYDKALESRAHVDSPSDLVHAQVYLLPTDCVMTSGIIVGSILHAGYQLLRMEELPISSSPDFIWKYCVTFYSKFQRIDKRVCQNLPSPTYDCWLQVNKDCPGDVLARAGLWEEGVERVISGSERVIRWHLAIWMDPMFKTKVKILIEIRFILSM